MSHHLSWSVTDQIEFDSVFEILMGELVGRLAKQNDYEDSI